MFQHFFFKSDMEKSKRRFLHFEEIRILIQTCSLIGSLKSLDSLTLQGPFFCLPVDRVQVYQLVGFLLDLIHQELQKSGRARPGQRESLKVLNISPSGGSWNETRIRVLVGEKLSRCS